jgi:anti-anti-sigma factor
MSEAKVPQVLCPVMVLAITETEIKGDLQAEQIRDEFLAAYGPSGAINVVLDFAKVTWLTSAGFRPLLSLHRRIRERGGRLVLCNLSPKVAEIFEVTRLVSSAGSSVAPFEKQPDVPAAIASLYR